jgi:hypothetical protein
LRVTVGLYLRETFKANLGFDFGWVYAAHTHELLFVVFLLSRFFLLGRFACRYAKLKVVKSKPFLHASAFLLLEGNQILRSFGFWPLLCHHIEH